MASDSRRVDSKIRRIGDSKTAYRSALRRLVSRSRFGSKPGLSRIKKLLATLGDPQKKFKCVLVAGTNGKGSTTAMLAGILSCAGYRAGSYFSPSIFSFRERMQVDGKWISKRDFAKAADEALSATRHMRDDPPTFFEVMTAMALLHFARKRVDYAVLEVGLGGRFDATNIVEPQISIITSIGLEHIDVLGNTTAKIAREKSGIVRRGRPIVCGVRDKAALIEIKRIARRFGAKLHIANASSLRGISIKAPGSFQRANAAMAASAAGIIGIKPAVIRRSLSSFRMPARWQKMRARPSMIIDCCHNPPAAKMIQTDLKRDFNSSPPSQSSSSSPRVLLFSAMKDKDYSLVLKRLAPHFDSIVLCRPPYKRAAALGILKKSAQHALGKTCPYISITAVSDPDKALAYARAAAGKEGRILVCGSMYLLQYLFGEREFRMTG